MALPAKILIVDDEPHIRAFLRKLVRANVPGCVAYEAGDTAAAVATYERERPDLVLLDVNLIGSSGLDALAQIRAVNPAAVVVMVTAVAVLGTVQKALESGAHGYILKDQPHEEISRTLMDLIATAFDDEPPPAKGPNT
jgi:DNA-binding NarL/FixJ family response regulator